MKMNSNYLILIFVFGIGVLNAQSLKKQILDFHPMYENANLQLNHTYHESRVNDSIQFENLKWYISKIEFLYDGKITWKEDNSFHLLDASIKSSLHLSFQIPLIAKYNQIRFNFGIDSTTNVSGAMGGDLDPTRGMYWTWQSGYINFKLEGKCNTCQTRNHEFQFHLGGYQFPYKALQTVSMDLKENEQININMDFSKWINEIDLSKQNHIMSPGLDAVSLSEKIAKSFSVSTK